jgi:hypothetical protein
MSPPWSPAKPVDALTSGNGRIRPVPNSRRIASLDAEVLRPEASDQKRRARDSNPLPLAGHHVSGVPSRWFITVQRRPKPYSVAGLGQGPDSANIHRVRHGTPIGLQIGHTGTRPTVEFTRRNRQSVGRSEAFTGGRRCTLLLMNWPSCQYPSVLRSCNSYGTASPARGAKSLHNHGIATCVLSPLIPEETMVRVSTTCTEVSCGQNRGLKTPPFHAA